ncbi:MAG: nicotinate phosphoribosyltransferase [Armatimonas sp.]
MIIDSLLDTDLYKFTMMQVVWKKFAELPVVYAFKCRAKNADLRPYAAEIRQEIDALASLRLTDDELHYLESIRYISPDFVGFLREFRLNPQDVTVAVGDELTIRIQGSWLNTILFEVPVLAIVNEVYARHTYPTTEELLAEGRRRLHAKIAAIDAAPTLPRIMEFGTRRRYSRIWQEEVVGALKDRLIGTSNVALAKKFGLRVFGTMAHEFLQAGQALVHPLDSQRYMLETWMQVYRGDLGIALSDIFGMDAFLNDFDMLFSKAYDGCRHDSGDPFEWGEELLAHYERLGIDARTKTAVFSDGLDIEKALALAERFDGRIRTMFGIGTSLTNDLGVPSLPIVLKMVQANGRPVIKLSDTPGKTMSENQAYENYLRSSLQQISRPAENQDPKGHAESPPNTTRDV